MKYKNKSFGSKNFIPYVFLFCVMTLFILLCSASAQAERRLVNKHGVTVWIMDEKGWCEDSKAYLTFSVDKKEIFHDDPIKLQQLIGGVRAIASFECPDMKTLIVHGRDVNGSVFHGQASESNNWILKGEQLGGKRKEEIKQPFIVYDELLSLNTWFRELTPKEEESFKGVMVIRMKPNAYGKVFSSDSLQVGDLVISVESSYSGSYSVGNLQELKEEINNSRDDDFIYHIKFGVLRDGSPMTAVLKLIIPSELMFGWMKLASNGDMDAQFHLGGIYSAGQWGEKDNLKAARWYKKSADQGHIEAKNALKKLNSLTVKKEEESHKSKAPFPSQSQTNSKTSEVPQAPSKRPQFVSVVEIEVDAHIALLGMVLEDTWGTRVGKILKDGPAFLAGLRTQDEILSVNGAKKTASMLEELRKIKFGQVAHIRAKDIASDIRLFHIRNELIDNVENVASNYEKIRMNDTRSKLAPDKEEDESSYNDNFCDRLAFHTADRDKPENIPGVSDDRIDPQLAIDSCIDEIKKNPSELRFRFQLARSLIAGGMIKEAVKILEDLTRRNHGPSQFYLAELLSAENGMAKDKVKAEGLYKKARKNGFYSEKVESSKIFYSGGYFWPDLLANTYDANFHPDGGRCKNIPHSIYETAPFICVLRGRRHMMHLSAALEKLCEGSFSKEQMQIFQKIEHFDHDGRIPSMSEAFRVDSFNEEMTYVYSFIEEAISDATKINERFSCESTTYRLLTRNMVRFFK